jgi:hypothetical protein
VKLIDTLAKPSMTFQDVAILILTKEIIKKTFQFNSAITTKLQKFNLEHHCPFYLGFILHNS